MTVSISFKNTDLAKWGVGLLRKLTSTEVDLNFWALKQAVETLQADLPAAAVGIDDFTLDGDQLTVTMTDATTRGPFTIPTLTWTFRGSWVASTAYSVGDVFTNGSSAYVVLFAHTSATSFDAGANDGSGHNYYGLLLTLPDGALYSTVERISDSTYELTVADAGKFFIATNAAGLTVTVPAHASVAIPTSAEYNFRQATGCPSITFVEGSSGVTISGRTGHALGTDAEGAVCQLKQTDVADDWMLYGDLSATSA